MRCLPAHLRTVALQTVDAINDRPAAQHVLTNVPMRVPPVAARARLYVLVVSACSGGGEGPEGRTSEE